MQLLAPDLLEEMRGFSVTVGVMAFFIGFMLWLFGWRAHRFWIVLTTTVAAGLLGLSSASAYQAQPMVTGLLLAVAAGAVALALIRLIAFAGGAIVAWVVVHTLVPSWNEPWLCLLGGGLLGLVLFRIWTMALTSFAGTLLMTYAGLCLAHKLGNVDIVDVAERQSNLLNCACGAVALLGLIVQHMMGRAKRKKDKKPDAKARSASGPIQSGGGGWWAKAQKVYRRAAG